MAAQSEGLDYFVIGSLVDYISLFLVFIIEKWTTKGLSHFWPLWILHSVYETVALGRVVPPKRHLKLENVLLQAIALECGVLRLIRRAFFNDTYHV